MNIIKEDNLVFSLYVSDFPDLEGNFICNFNRVVGYLIIDSGIDGQPQYNIIDDNYFDEYACIIDVDRGLAYDCCPMDEAGTYHYNGEEYTSMIDLIQSKFPTVVEFI